MTSAQHRPQVVSKSVILVIWALFAVTVVLDANDVVDLILLKSFDVILAAWILASVLGLVGAIRGLRGWQHWRVVCATAAVVLIVANAIYLYDVFLGRGDRTLGVALQYLWKTAWISITSGAFAVAYRELFMPLIQVVLLGYFAATLYARKPRAA